MLLLIVGCRRSGTTVFWEQFRRDSRFVCYDEPFNPLLVKQLPFDNRKNTLKELLELHAADPPTFWKNYAPIQPSDEVSPVMTAPQIRYLRFLAAQGEYVAVDTTRCHFKLRAIAESLPETVLVHLHRSPAAFASSHVDPSTSRFDLTEAEFWGRSKGFNRWNIQEIIGHDCQGPAGHRVLDQLQGDAGDMAQAPAIVKLLAYWKIFHDEVEATGVEVFGDRFLSVPFEAFCRTPENTVSAVYRLLNLEPPAPDFTGIDQPRGARFPDSPKWQEYAQAAGLPGDPAFLFRDSDTERRAGPRRGAITRSASIASSTRRFLSMIDWKLTGGASIVFLRHLSRVFSKH